MLEPAEPYAKCIALAAFLGEIDAKPWAWRESDCAGTVAAWIWHLHGIDPAAEIHYSTAEEAQVLAVAHGGFVEWVSRCLDPYFAQVCNGYEPGDVAVVDAGPLALPSLVGVLAIRSANIWVVKTPRGLIGKPFRAIQGWRL